MKGSELVCLSLRRVLWPHFLLDLEGALKPCMFKSLPTSDPPPPPARVWPVIINLHRSLFFTLRLLKRL